MPHPTDETQDTPHETQDPTLEQRRALLKGGIVAAPVVLITLVSRPVFGLNPCASLSMSMKSSRNITCPPPPNP